MRFRNFRLGTVPFVYKRASGAPFAVQTAACLSNKGRRQMSDYSAPGLFRPSRRLTASGFPRNIIRIRTIAPAGRRCAAGEQAVHVD
jgi:hypothetical protein